MSLTNIVYTPVDTGMAKVRKVWDNPNTSFFYLLAGKLTPVSLQLRRLPAGRQAPFSF